MLLTLCFNVHAALQVAGIGDGFKKAFRVAAPKFPLPFLRKLPRTANLENHMDNDTVKGFILTNVYRQTRTHLFEFDCAYIKHIGQWARPMQCLVTKKDKKPKMLICFLAPPGTAKRTRCVYSKGKLDRVNQTAGVCVHPTYLFSFLIQTVKCFRDFVR
jgi:hypothetical protein